MKAKVSDFIQDDRNLNKGTARGKVLMDKSLSQFGAGRSILVDKDNRIIAGNKTQLAALKAGIVDAEIIETTGDVLVAVKRTDVSLDTKEGRELAFADNETSEVNILWDDNEMAAMTEELGIDANEWGLQVKSLDELSDTKEPVNNNKDEVELKISFTPEQYSFVLEKLRKYGDDFRVSLLTILNV